MYVFFSLFSSVIRVSREIEESRCLQLDQLLSPPGESRRDLEAERERKKKDAKRRKGKRKVAKAKGDSVVGNEEGEPDENENRESDLGSECEDRPRVKD